MILFSLEGSWTMAARIGRVERALERELSERDDIGPAERAALRSQARAVDVAEGLRDPHAVTAANHGYLELRQAAGITAGADTGTDTFAELLAELGRPTGSVRD